MDGKQINEYTFSDGGDGIIAKAVNCGATLTALEVSNAHGGKTDVLLALTSARDIVCTGSYMGSFVGRCCNRIDGGAFYLNGARYSLAKNDGGVNSLHGGNVGFNQKILSSHAEGNGVCFFGESSDGEENYPGALTFSVVYTVVGSALVIDYFAEADCDTVFSPTNHSYFNLNGQDDGDISDNVLQIFADRFLPINSSLIPTGEERSVCGTPFDFRQGKSIGRDIDSNDEQLKIAGGFDHNFCLSDATDGFDLVSYGISACTAEKIQSAVCGLKLAARAFSPKTGIVAMCFTDRPGLQFYTGNFLLGEKGKAVYPRRSGFCLETQTYPNAINMPQWLRPVLKGGEKFHSRTVYVFGVCR